MKEITQYKKLSVKVEYAKYCYLLEGRGRVMYFWFRAINNHDEADEFQRQNTIIMIFY